MWRVFPVSQLFALAPGGDLVLWVIFREFCLFNLFHPSLFLSHTSWVEVWMFQSGDTRGVISTTKRSSPSSGSSAGDNPVLTQTTFQWVLLPQSELTALKLGPEELILGWIIALDDLSQPEGFCDLLAAFTSPQDQNCSSLLTKKNFSQGTLCRLCTSECPTTFSAGILVFFEICLMFHSKWSHSLEVVVKAQLKVL